MISIVFPLILAEIGIRIYLPNTKTLPKVPTQWVIVPEQVWTERHPILGWYHEKNKHALLKRGDLEVEINTNSQGFRGIREYQLEKPPGTVRVVTLGDSFAFGWGVQDRETFSAKLESGYQNLEVLNLGVAGYGVDQLLLMFRTIGKSFRPDYVFITVFPEDFWRATRAFTDAGYGKPYFQLVHRKELILKNVPVREPAKMDYRQFPDIIVYGPVERTLMHSALYRYLKKKALRLARDLGWIDPDLTEEWRLGEAMLRDLVREIREVGARPLLIVIPPGQWMTITKPTSIQKSILRFGKRLNVDVLYVTPLLIEAVKSSRQFDFYIEGDEHWTAKGHSLAADLLAKYLEEQNSMLRRNVA